MRATDVPIDALSLSRLLLRATEAKESESPARRVAEPATRPGLWERLDRWLAKARQRDRERYLAQAHDVFDLEARIRALDRQAYD